jgi:DGQHR domain-containing protein
MEPIEFSVIASEVLGINTYRGTGLLSDIALISKADIFDQKTNPTGTQRDLNVGHAKAAYTYVLNQRLAFWPEVVLCCRKSEVLNFRPFDKHAEAGYLRVNLDLVERLAEEGIIAISRLDGNHRLHFADGSSEGFEPVRRSASFCILMNLTPLEEIQLFRDINNNQRRMSTSHLDNITVRLTEEEILQIENPALYIAKRLGDDKESPFYARVSESGKKTADRDIPLRGLHTGIRFLRSESSKLKQVNDIEAEYILIRTYWQAVLKWEPAAWTEPKKYLLLRGSGFWGACFLGGRVIDRCLEQGKYRVEDMLKVLRSGRTWDWGRNGDFRGLGGRGGAVEIADKISKEFPTGSGISMRKLVSKIKAG